MYHRFFSFSWQEKNCTISHELSSHIVKTELNYLVFLIGGNVMGVDIAQPCNYDIHSCCTMRIKFLKKGDKSLTLYQRLYAQLYYYIIVIYQGRIGSYSG